MASESETMLPCPFCGSVPAFVPYKRDGLTLKCSFGCVKFSQRAMRFDLEWLRGKMTETWNRRAPSAEAKDAERYRFIRDVPWKDDCELAPVIEGQMSDMWDKAIDDAIAQQKGNGNG